MPAVPIHYHVDLPGFISGFITVPDGSEQPQQLQDGKHEVVSFCERKE